MTKGLLALVGIALLANCSKGDKIATVRVKPPVEASLPSSIVNGTSVGLVTTDYTKTCQTDASQGDACQNYEGAQRIQCIVKQRFFCTGPTAVLTLLDSLDGRLNEIEERSEKGEVDCINKDPVDLTSALTFPGDATLAGHFKCVDSSIPLGFGEKDGVWHVREANGAAGQAFTISTAGVVDGYIWLPTPDGTFSQSTGLVHIRADRDNDLFEMTGGGVGLGFCSFHIASNAANLYIYANPDGVGSSCDFNQDNTTDSDDWATACLDAVSLDAAAAGSCDTLAASLKMTTLGRAESAANGGRTSSWDAAAVNAAGGPVTFELNTYLSELFAAAKLFPGVSEFKTK